MLGPIVEYGAVCWELYLSWSGVLRPIVEYGAVCWDQ